MSSGFANVRGKTFGLDIRDDIVYIGDIEMTKSPEETQTFVNAYRIGREHKKLEIREVLDL